MNDEREVKRMRETEVATRVLSNPIAKGRRAMIIIGCNINHFLFVLVIKGESHDHH